MEAVPSRLLTASDALPTAAAVPTAATSGSEVMPPRRSIPVKAMPSPVFVEMPSTYATSRVPASQTMTAETAKLRQVSTREGC